MKNGLLHIIYKLNLIFLVFLLISTGISGTTLITGDCDSYSSSQFTIGGNTTCSPSFCTMVTNAASSNANAGSVVANDYVIRQITNLGSKTCTQSTAAQCSYSSLNSVVKSGGGLRAIYCNDKFLVIHSVGYPNHLDGLMSIPRPPGDGVGGSYSAQGVTRSYNQAYAVYKIPLTPVDLGVSSASNNLAAFSGQTDPASYSSYGLPTSGAVAITVSGQSIFPLFNDQGYVTHSMCEIDKCSAHAGKGFDYHYHGDPFSSTSGKCMYSTADYSDATNGHPPLIAWALDGYKVYGRHLATTNIGYSTALDVCGGHIHDSYEYHYHSQVLNLTSVSSYGTGRTYKAYIGGVYQCWRGNITISNIFKNTVQFTSRADYNDLKPCSSSSQYWSASGITMPTITFSTSSPTSAPTGPTMAPIANPTMAPIASPTMAPIASPTLAPIASPTSAPIASPTSAPIVSPTLAPIASPTMAPIASPTMAPIASPTSVPIASPTSAPIVNPTLAPTPAPSSAPSLAVIIYAQVSMTMAGISSSSITDAHKLALRRSLNDTLQISLSAISSPIITDVTNAAVASAKHKSATTSTSKVNNNNNFRSFSSLTSRFLTSGISIVMIVEDSAANLGGSSSASATSAIYTTLSSNLATFVSSFQSYAISNGALSSSVSSVSVSSSSLATIDISPTASPTASPTIKSTDSSSSSSSLSSSLLVVAIVVPIGAVVLIGMIGFAIYYHQHTANGNGNGNGKDKANDIKFFSGIGDIEGKGKSNIDIDNSHEYGMVSVNNED